IVTGHALVARDGIGQDDLIGVADMRLGRRIGNGGRDIVRFLFHSLSFLLNSFSLSYIIPEFTAAINRMGANSSKIQAEKPPLAVHRSAEQATVAVYSCFCSGMLSDCWFSPPSGCSKYQKYMSRAL